MSSLEELRREREIHQNSARLIDRMLAGLRDSYRLGRGSPLPIMWMVNRSWLFTSIGGIFAVSVASLLETARPIL